MLIRNISNKDSKVFDQVATHPLQSYAWGEFRKKTGVGVERVGVFDDNGKLKNGCQVTIHNVPRTNYKIGYFPKGVMPNKTQLDVLRELGRKHNLILIKLEPNVGIEIDKQKPKAFKQVDKFLIDNGCQKGRPLFTKYSFQIDLTRSEEELMANKKLYYVGSLDRAHGIKSVIKTMPAIISQAPQVKLIIFGVGPEASALKDYTMALNIEKHVDFLGYVDNKEVLSNLARGGIGLAPYKATDGWVKYCDPVKIKEYLACGCPVIVSSVVEVAKMIKKRKAGLVYDSENEMQKSILYLINNPSKYRQMSSGAKRAGEKFDLEKLYSRYFKTFI